MKKIKPGVGKVSGSKKKGRAQVARSGKKVKK
jgi:hypothetical protein